MLGMRIVFVCTGNASRSAAAEVVLRKMLADSGLRGVEVTSCGTGVPAGLEREAVMCRIAEEHGYEMGGEAVAMSAGMFADADLLGIPLRIIVSPKNMKQGVVEVASRDKTLKTQIPLENVMEEIKQYL